MRLHAFDRRTCIFAFCCGETEGDKDLEDFFHHNALLYAQERLGKTYCFVNNEGEFSEIVAFFTVSMIV